MLIRIVALSFALTACASDDEGTAPAAPTNLSVSPLGAGAHLTWKDNSTDETEFVIMRQQAPSAMAELSRVPFNGTSYHDEPITAGATYVYMIVATNENGDSQSNQAMFVAP